jgi:hypothetical protein
VTERQWFGADAELAVPERSDRRCSERTARRCRRIRERFGAAELPQRPSVRPGRTPSSKSSPGWAKSRCARVTETHRVGADAKLEVRATVAQRLMADEAVADAVVSTREGRLQVYAALDRHSHQAAREHERKRAAEKYAESDATGRRRAARPLPGGCPHQRGGRLPLQA